MFSFFFRNPFLPKRDESPSERGFSKTEAWTWKDVPLRPPEGSAFRELPSTSLKHILRIEEGLSPPFFLTLPLRRRTLRVRSLHGGSPQEFFPSLFPIKKDIPPPPKFLKRFARLPWLPPGGISENFVPWRREERLSSFRTSFSKLLRHFLWFGRVLFVNWHGLGFSTSPRTSPPVSTLHF